ncbi:uncharacterized protein BDW43DRAFT_307969 [Aspergillus alliaceus]|uniref:uncharacterized protein n=1 Tax=Petromyces alliaceus TaxID=209559 RepID=UPI0012A74F70|nr:uncharacterized protein BDW43DRAFT_307969 [Aspergillus alliaceus]KAB8236956.1 hypothetical protein BDW43DRAFT_307969 [Aspergillus alliaceus]
MVDDSNQETTLGIIIAFSVLVGTPTFQRFWGRYLSRSSLQSDDYLIVLRYSVAMWYSECIILCVGGVATFVGIWRLIWHLVILSKGFFSAFLLKDPTYDIGFRGSAVEVHVAVMSACAPATKAIATKYLPRLLGTSRQEETSRYSTASASNWFLSGYGSSRPKSAVRSRTDDGFKLAEPYQAKVDPIAGERGMRKYQRGDSPS